MREALAWLIRGGGVHIVVDEVRPLIEAHTRQQDRDE